MSSDAEKMETIVRIVFENFPRTPEAIATLQQIGEDWSLVDDLGDLELCIVRKARLELRQRRENG